MRERTSGLKMVYREQGVEPCMALALIGAALDSVALPNFFTSWRQRAPRHTVICYTLFSLPPIGARYSAMLHYFKRFANSFIHTSIVWAFFRLIGSNY
jgi:hypothetical protein